VFEVISVEVIYTTNLKVKTTKHQKSFMASEDCFSSTHVWTDVLNHLICSEVNI